MSTTLERMDARRSAYETKTAGDVCAYALLWQGEFAGRIFGVCPSSTWTVTLTAFKGPLADAGPNDRTIGLTESACGGGYDKIGHAVASMIRAAGFPANDSSTHATGDLEAIGYDVHRIV